ncbi:hypothetical protein [Mucilaginibacter ginkgonis]|uniref:Holin n=1 Tax=Mucilaginibacter ginkgonis TaxID=2682091 RepID=A0A6I4HYY1_9SPHI|nr:hypothetical protein [Mucilaginibacter ginkgonis]QQL50326.1 hypothetical protein GO620_002405 [Mucilaginibacter ginkgonis]
MEKKYSLWQRFMSDTPSFFKYAQAFGLSVAALGATLSQISGIPEKLTTILISVGSTVAAVAQFAVKQSISTNIDHEIK